MWLSAALSLCVISLQLAGAQLTEDTTYSLIAPMELYYPSTGQACIQGTNLSPIYLMWGLSSSQGWHNVANFYIREYVAFECFEFEVPFPAGQQEMMTISVNGLGVGGFTVWALATQVLVKTMDNGVFVQTDKPIYMPGQLVRCRMVTMDHNFKVNNETVPLIELRDPNLNLTKQWHEVPTERGIAEISYQLHDQCLPGTYTFTVGSTQKTFTVEEYVLHKSELIVTVPASISFQDRYFHMEVCARYGFGEPAQGTVWCKVCHEAYFKFKSIAPTLCYEYSVHVNKSGCHIETVDTSNLDLDNMLYQRNLDVKASFIEDGTGAEINASSQTIQIPARNGTIQLQGKSYFQRGNNYNAKVRLTDAHGSPMPNKNVTLSYSLNSGDFSSFQFNQFTDDNGIASFDLDTADWSEEYATLQAASDTELPFRQNPFDMYYSVFKNLRRLHSNTSSTISIRPAEGVAACGQVLDVVVDYSMSMTDLVNETTEVAFYYLVVCKFRIVDYGIRNVLVQESEPRGYFTIGLDVNNISQSANMVVYTVNSDKAVAADGATFDVAKCFPHKVSLNFSENKVLPGANVTLQLHAAPNSICGLLAVDQGVLLNSPGSDQYTEEVHGMFTHNSQVKWYDTIGDPEPCSSNAPTTASSAGNVGMDKTTTTEPMVSSGISYRVTQYDFKAIMKEAGLNISSNLLIEAPPKCSDLTSARPRYLYSEGTPGKQGAIPMNMPTPGTADTPAESETASVEKQESVWKQERVWFPETWIWDLLVTGEDGEVESNFTSPDSITDWKATAFCITDIGFGLSPTQNLITFQPFFVETYMPYSIVQAETHILKAIVFNYLNACLKIYIRMTSTEDFVAKKTSEDQYFSCLCTGDSKTFEWYMTATKLGPVNVTVRTEALDTSELCNGQPTVVPANGRIDIVTKPLLVKEQNS